MSVGVWAPPPRVDAAVLLGYRFEWGKGGAPARVLIVEDDEMIAEMYRSQLEHDGYDVDIAPDGPSGLEALRSGRFDLALVDVRLPGIDGLEMLAESRQAGVRTPVVIVTNYSEVATRRRSEELGAVDYVVKSRVLPGWLSERIPRWVRGEKAI